MFQSKDSFTAGEVRELVYYGQTVVFDAVQATLRANKEECEAITLRMLRRNMRLAIFPELILKEIPKGIPKENTKSGKGLSIEARELLFNLLGNRSRDVVSLSDVELCKLVGQMLLDYR